MADACFTYRYVAPCAALRPFVERIWTWRSGGCVPPRLLPGTGAELFIHLSAPPRAEVGEGLFAELPRAHLICMRSRAAALVAGGPVEFVSIRFRAGALRHFTSRASADLYDRFAGVEEVLGPAGAALAEEVGAARDFHARARCIEAHLLAVLCRRGAQLGPVDAALARLYYGAGHMNVGDVAREFGASGR